MSETSQDAEKMSGYGLDFEEIIDKAVQQDVEVQIASFGCPLPVAARRVTVDLFATHIYSRIMPHLNFVDGRNLGFQPSHTFELKPVTDVPVANSSSILFAAAPDTHGLYRSMRAPGYHGILDNEYLVRALNLEQAEALVEYANEPHYDTGRLFGIIMQLSPKEEAKMAEFQKEAENDAKNYRKQMPSMY